MKRVLFTLTLFAIATEMWAQDIPTISKTVNLVTLLATVHDKNGRIINNLTADDFVLEEDGKPQKISFFSRESNLPLTIGLLVDTSRSQTEVLTKESQASKKFLEQVLREGKDEAFISHFDIRVETLQGLTSSHSDLASALGQLRIPEEYSTLLYTAVQKSSDDVMRKQQGRKADILLTDGVAYRDPTSMETAIESAQRADTILYAIRFSDPIVVTAPMRAAFRAAAAEHGKMALKRMSSETGGASYEVTGKQTIGTIYSQIEDELRNQYSIGYTPGRPGPDGKYHKIQLKTKNRDLVVSTRKGYYAR
jgi:VWFA-related protein